MIVVDVEGESAVQDPPLGDPRIPFSWRLFYRVSRGMSKMCPMISKRGCVLIVLLKPRMFFFHYYFPHYFKKALDCFLTFREREQEWSVYLPIYASSCSVLVCDLLSNITPQDQANLYVISPQI